MKLPRRLSALVKRSLRSADLSLFRGNVVPLTTRQMRNVLLYGSMWEKLEGLEGSVVECGVGKGRSFVIFNFLADREGKNRTVWGFDSFEGFPEVSGEDASDRMPKRGDWAGTSIEDVISLLSVAGLGDRIPSGKARLEKGFFEQTLSRYSNEPIALLHVDCDLYESYRTVFSMLYPLVVIGGIVLFDEYGEKKWPGATKAVDEFVAEHGLMLCQEPIAGKWYVTKK